MNGNKTVNANFSALAQYVLTTGLPRMGVDHPQPSDRYVR